MINTPPGAGPIASCMILYSFVCTLSASWLIEDPAGDFKLGLRAWRSTREKPGSMSHYVEESCPGNLRSRNICTGNHVSEKQTFIVLSF